MALDSKKLQEIAKKNLVLVVSYGIVIACGVGAYFVNQKAATDLLKLRSDLQKNTAALAKFSALAPAELPTAEVLKHWENVLTLYGDEEKKVREIFDRADKPLEVWFNDSVKGDSFEFATVYQSERVALIAKHQAILPAEPPSGLKEQQIDRDTDTATLMKQFRIMEQLLKAASAAGVEIVERLDFGAVQKGGGGAPPKAGAAPAEEPEVRIALLPITFTAQMRFPKVNALISEMLKSSIPFEVTSMTISKRAFNVDDLYTSIPVADRPDIKKLKLHPVPNETQKRVYYDDLTYTIELDEVDWAPTLEAKLLPEPPVLVTLKIAALDISLRQLAADPGTAPPAGGPAPAGTSEGRPK